MATALPSFRKARYQSQPMVAMLIGKRKAEVILTFSEYIGHQTGTSLIYGILILNTYAVFLIQLRPSNDSCQASRFPLSCGRSPLYSTMGATVLCR